MLDLSELQNGLPGITREWGAVLAQIAGVCLESQGHSRYVPLQVIGCVNNVYFLAWPQITSQAYRTWADFHESTEYGATAIDVLLAKRETSYSVIERSAKGTGIDYWLGDEAYDGPFQRKARLEVSGILNAGEKDRDVERVVRARTREKIKRIQTLPSSQLPVYVIVIEFGQPIAEVQEV